MTSLASSSSFVPDWNCAQIGGEVYGRGGAKRADPAFLGENALYPTRNDPSREPGRGKQRACR